MQARAERKIFWGLALAVAIIAGLGAIFYIGSAVLIADAERVDHEHTEINTLTDFYSQVQDIRIASRGFAVFGDERFLRHQHLALNRAMADLEVLETLSENDRDRANLLTVRQLFREKLKSTDQLVNRRRESGLMGCLQLVGRQLDQDLNDDLRATLGNMIQQQREELVRSAQSARNSSRRMRVAIICGCLAELVVAVAAAVAIRRFLRERQNALSELRRSAAELSDAKDAIEQQASVLAENTAQLEIARQNSDAASAAKSTFLANMSHEIRTPLTAILGYAELLLEPDQSASDRHDCLQIVRRSAKHLLELINDILDLSKIEAGRMTIECIPCSAAQLISEVVSMIRPRAQEKKVALRLDFDGPIPERINTDPLRLRQILVNLLGNAIKFTTDGDVIVRVSCDRAPDNRGVLQVRIVDTGIGMTRDQLERIFQPFTQADDATTRRFGGTGLGLTISKRLTEMLGGDITVVSEPGVGSTFTVAIVVGDLSSAHWIHGLTETTYTAVPEPSTRAETTLRGRILLVEDGRDNQRLISTHLRRAGAEVVLAENGRSALDLIQSQAFDLVLMDMQMPEMDGYEATRAMRALGCRLPIIALTAHAMAGDRDKGIAAGCTDYLTKPIDKGQLLWTIASYLNPSDAASAHSAPAPQPAASSEQAALKSEFADDAQMTDLVNDFVRELPLQVSRLHELLEQQRLDDLRRLVHQIKGAGGGYGFAPLSAFAASAEQTIRHAPDAARVEEAVKSLIELIRRVEGYQSSLEKEPCLKKS